jgi:hypothetical protein
MSRGIEALCQLAPPSLVEARNPAVNATVIGPWPGVNTRPDAQQADALTQAIDVSDPFGDVPVTCQLCPPSVEVTSLAPVGPPPLLSGLPDVDA